MISEAEMEAVKMEAVKVEAKKVEAVKMKAEGKDRAQATVDMILKKGSPSCFLMKTMLANNDPALYKTLGFK